MHPTAQHRGATNSTDVFNVVRTSKAALGVHSSRALRSQRDGGVALH